MLKEAQFLVKKTARVYDGIQAWQWAVNIKPWAVTKSRGTCILALA